MSAPPPGRFPRFRLPSSERQRSVSLTPPFTFEGVTARVFPLRAHGPTLQRFCDRYLNIIPPEVGRFRVLLPKVSLSLINYGRMAIDVANEGWLAQREIVFSIPLEWYRLVNGRWVFHDWALVCPFIFVDQDMSLAVGRSVYGWPKATAHLRATESAWMQDPTAPLFDATVSTSVFPDLYTGRELEEQVFLEIERKSAMGSLRLPVDARHPMAPWTLASRMAESAVDLSRDYLGLLAGLGILPMNPTSDATNVLARLGRLGGWGLPMRPNIVTNSINLKQFRSSWDTENFCFQAVTNGPMRYTAYNRIGLLGDDRCLLGDLTGGFSIRLHRWPTLPIVETLGLEVSRRWQGPRAEVVELSPVIPYWVDVDMEYLPGCNLAWRAQNATWHDAAGRSYPPPRGDAGPRVDERRFNTTLGASNQVLVGPFRFSGATLRVLPLLAYRKKLVEVIDHYLNGALKSSGDRFSLWGPPEPTEAEREAGKEAYAYVYMVVSDYGVVTSTTNNIGDWADAEVAFMVPVCRTTEREGKDEVSVGLVPLTVYVDSATAAAARAEVLGLPTVQASFGRPESGWVQDRPRRRGSRRTLLEVRAALLPALGEGQQARTGTVIEVSAGGKRPPRGSQPWATIGREELERKQKTRGRNGRLHEEAVELALDLLGNEQPLLIYTLKQIRDVADPDRAAYQSLVRVKSWLRPGLDLREMEQRIEVRIRDTPTFPLVTTLGLVATREGTRGLGLTYVIRPVRPFRMKLNLAEGRGTRLLFRAGGLRWIREKEGGPAERREREAEGKILDYPDTPYQQAAPMRQDRQAVPKARKAPERDAAAVHAALLAIDPQMIVEAVLSREVGSRDLDSRRRVEARRLRGRLTVELAGLQDSARPDRERKFLETLLKEREALLGAPAHEAAGKMLVRLHQLAGELADVEERIRRLEVKIERVVRPNPRRAGRRREHTEAVLVQGKPRMLKTAASILVDSLRGTVWAPDLEELLPADSEPDAARQPGKESWQQIQALLDRSPSPEKLLEDGLRLAHERVELQRSTLLLALAGTGRKADFCIPRYWVGEELDDLPGGDEEWFTGVV